jgi:hypothetical protein
VIDRAIPWMGVYFYIADLADAKTNAAEYAMKVRELYDVLIEEGGDPAEVHGTLLYFDSLRSPSKQHTALVAKLLPRPPHQKGPGRPKGALSVKAYDQRYQLYLDWIYEKTLNPSLTKEQFAKERLHITDEELKGEYASDHHLKVNALLQELKPARMKQLDEGHRRSLEILYPLLLTTSRKNLYREWRAAKDADPALTKEQFVKDDLGFTDEYLRSNPQALNLVQVQLTCLEQGKKLYLEQGKELMCAPSSPSQGRRARPTTKSKRTRAR